MFTWTGDVFRCTYMKCIFPRRLFNSQCANNKCWAKDWDYSGSSEYVLVMCAGLHLVLGMWHGDSIIKNVCW